MKKAILLPLVLTFVGALCQAEGAPLITMTAELQTGLRDIISFAGSTVSDAVSLYDIDSGNPSRFRIGLGFTSQDSNWGITTRLDSESLAGPNMGASWNQALVWGKLFDGLVLLKSGLLDETAFRLLWRHQGMEVIWGAQFDGQLGAEIQVKPLSGLTVGAILPIANGLSMLDLVSASNIAATYSMPGFMNVSGGIQLAKAANSAYAWIGADWNAVPNLVARIYAQATNIGDANLSWLQIYQEAAYPVEGFTINLRAWEEFYALANSSVGWQLEPTVSYPIGIVTLALTGDIGSLLAADPHPGVASLPFGFGVGTYAVFALAPTSTIALGCYAGQPDVSISAGALQFYVNYRWSF
jgi:hypothetical protein